MLAAALFAAFSVGRGTEMNLGISRKIENQKRDICKGCVKSGSNILLKFQFKGCPVFARFFLFDVLDDESSSSSEPPEAMHLNECKLPREW
jgi:hypothetical protein